MTGPHLFHPGPGPDEIFLGHAVTGPGPLQIHLGSEALKKGVQAFRFPSGDKRVRLPGGNHDGDSRQIRFQLGVHRNHRPKKDRTGQGPGSEEQETGGDVRSVRQTDRQHFPGVKAVVTGRLLDKVRQFVGPSDEVFLVEDALLQTPEEPGHGSFHDFAPRAQEGGVRVNGTTQGDKITLIPSRPVEEKEGHGRFRMGRGFEAVGKSQGSFAVIHGSSLSHMAGLGRTHFFWGEVSKGNRLTGTRGQPLEVKTVEDADVIVVGAGHNSLAAAAYLASAGLRILVLERDHLPGGDTMSEELTLPGFVHDSCSSAHNLIQTNPLIRDDELKLSSFGLKYLRPDPSFTIPFEDGESITMFLDPQKTAAEISRHSADDAVAYLQLLEDWKLLAPLQAKERGGPPQTPEDLQKLWRSGPLGDEGLRLRMATGLEVIDERFRHPKVKAFMAWVATMTLDPLNRPGTGLMPFSLTNGRQVHSWTTPVGGSGTLPGAMIALIEKAGGQIITSSSVAKILIEDGRAKGVTTEDGRTFLARRAVLSSQHIKELPKSLGGAMDEESLAYIDRWRSGLTMFVTHYAVSEAPHYKTWDGGHTSVAMGALRSVEHLQDLISSFERGRVHLDGPFFLVINSSLVDPGRAPGGNHTLKVVGIQPYGLAEGPEHWDQIKEEVSDSLLESYMAYTTNLTPSHILARHVESPLDLERRNPNNYRGSCHGGDSVFSQSGHFRPAPRWSGYRTPVEGLYLTGSTTHPGGSVSAFPGRNAARVMFEDLALDFQGALARAASLAAAGI